MYLQSRYDDINSTITSNIQAEIDVQFNRLGDVVDQFETCKWPWRDIDIIVHFNNYACNNIELNSVRHLAQFTLLCMYNHHYCNYTMCDICLFLRLIAFVMIFLVVIVCFTILQTIPALPSQQVVAQLYASLYLDFITTNI